METEKSKLNGFNGIRLISFNIFAFNLFAIIVTCILTAPDSGTDLS